MRHTLEIFAILLLGAGLVAASDKNGCHNTQAFLLILKFVWKSNHVIEPIPMKASPRTSAAAQMVRMRLPSYQSLEGPVCCSRYSPFLIGSCYKDIDGGVCEDLSKQVACII
jgi:hypothetical protein